MARRTSRRQTPRRSGFTLIELLVAIAAMALLALMSWRGLDGISRTTTLNQRRGDALLTLQTGLSQWSADLDGIVTLAHTQAINWDGRVLRLTRRSTDAQSPTLYVVAWTLRSAEAGGRWHRWQSPGLTTRGDWQKAWDGAAAWAQDGSLAQSDADVALMPVESWQLSYFRDNKWLALGGAGSAGASGAAGPAGASATAIGVIADGVVPDGMRLVLRLPPGDGLSGSLTRDWVRPTFGAAKS